MKVPRSRVGSDCRTLRRAAFLLAAAVGLSGCAGQLVPQEARVGSGAEPARGVLFRQYVELESRISILDVALDTPGLSIEIIPRRPRRRRGRLDGEALKVAEWLARSGAVAGVNGGFFGEDTAADRKEILGLFVQSGRPLLALPPLRSQSSGVRYARSGFGLDAGGRPSVTWAAAPAGTAGPRSYPTPELDGQPGTSWDVDAALGCGPRLLHEGKRAVTDRQERLVSPGALPRTFVGYSVVRGQPKTLVLATASALTFEGCARVLQRYFRHYHHCSCAEAMALDGGASTQMAYRLGDRIVEPQYGLATVPTAILVRSGAARPR